jgi:nicotinamide-nucleotide amidase
MSRELATHGISVARRATVGDIASDIASAVQGAIDRTGGVITTGGLGPTSDDVTKPAIAALFGRRLEFNAEQWERLRTLWKSRGRPGEPVEINKQQVMLPSGASVLVNDVGTAPGVFLEDDDGRWVAMLPGVPREMRLMLTNQLLPLLLARRGATYHVIRTRTVRTTGVAESLLAEALGDLANGIPGAPLAYLPGVEGVDLRLTVRDVAADDAERVLAEGAARLCERIGRHAYAIDGTDLAEVVLDACRARGLKLALAESCTGGLLGARLTAIPGSSDVLVGGVIAYSNAVKESALGVSGELLRAQGAVSEEVARAMASGVRRSLGADIGIAITGVAGPSGGTPEKPVGLVWIAVDFGNWSIAAGPRYFGDRAEVRFRATQSALDLTRRRLEDTAAR